MARTGPRVQPNAARCNTGPRTRARPSTSGAVLGFPNYWYPACGAREVSARPKPMKLLGEPLVFLRRHGVAYAIQDECPHRGARMALGKYEFPGSNTITCRFHGMTYDVTNGAWRGRAHRRPRQPHRGQNPHPHLPGRGAQGHRVGLDGQGSTGAPGGGRAEAHLAGRHDGEAPLPHGGGQLALPCGAGRRRAPAHAPRRRRQQAVPQEVRVSVRLGPRDWSRRRGWYSWDAGPAEVGQGGVPS